MFERMEIAEAIYERGAPFKNNQQAEDYRSSYGRDKKEGRAASPLMPEKRRTGNSKKRNALHLSILPWLEIGRAKDV